MKNAGKTLHLGLGGKLFLFLVVVVILVYIPVVYAVFTSISSLEVQSVKADQVRSNEQVQQYLVAIAQQKARKYEEFLKKVTVASSLIASTAQQIYKNMPHSLFLPDRTKMFSLNAGNRILYNAENSNVTDLYWGNEGLDAVVDEVKALALLDGPSRHAIGEIRESSMVHIVTMSGLGRFYYRDEQTGRNLFNLPQAAVFDLRDGLPAKSVIHQNRVVKDTQWTTAYRYLPAGSPTITAASPVLNAAGNLIAVVGVDVPLKFILDDLQYQDDDNFPVKSINTLFSMIIHRNGEIVAMPTDHFESFGIPVHTAPSEDRRDSLSIHLSDSNNESVRHLLPVLLQAFGRTLQIEIGEKGYFVTTQQLEGTDWYFAQFAERPIDLIGMKGKTGRIFSETIRKLITTFSICALIMGMILFMASLVFIRSFVHPILKLRDLAAQVGQGNLDVRTRFRRIDEIGDLARTFDSMIERLHASETIRRDYANTLEKKVHERTHDLQNKNAELENIVDLLKIERDHRQKAVQELELSEQQFKTAMDASLAGLFVLQYLKFQYVNPAMARIFGYSRDEFLTDDHMLERIAGRDFVERWRHTRHLPGDFAENPYQIRCMCRDGKDIDILIGGAAILWKGEPAVIGHIIDISHQKQIEDRLRDREQRLQESLAEKEVLLREVYHRTKNNMLVIIALLHLRAIEIEDGKTRELFLATENRVRAMSLVHEKLYQSQSLSELDFSVYLLDLVSTLVQAMCPDGRITYEVTGSSLLLSIDQAVPLGLAVNELVTNALKHAFPDGRSGIIYIRLTDRHKDGFELEIGDTGIGLPESLDIFNTSSFGMQITTNLIVKQLRGRFSVQRGHGTSFRIEIDENVQPKRV